jgi:hypothetical protein
MLAIRILISCNECKNKSWSVKILGLEFRGIETDEKKFASGNDYKTGYGACFRDRF